MSDVARLREVPRIERGVRLKKAFSIASVLSGRYVKRPHSHVHNNNNNFGKATYMFMASEA